MILSRTRAGLCCATGRRCGTEAARASRASRLQYSDLPAIQQTAGRVGAEDGLPELARRYAAIRCAVSPALAAPVRNFGRRIVTSGVEFLRVRVPTAGSHCAGSALNRRLCPATVCRGERRGRHGGRDPPSSSGYGRQMKTSDGLCRFICRSSSCRRDPPRHVYATPCQAAPCRATP